jgi:hypothetical protein
MRPPTIIWLVVLKAIVVFKRILYFLSCRFLSVSPTLNHPEEKRETVPS